MMVCGYVLHVVRSTLFLKTFFILGVFSLAFQLLTLSQPYLPEVPSTTVPAAHADSGSTLPLAYKPSRIVTSSAKASIPALPTPATQFPNIVSHGKTQCLDALTHDLEVEALKLRSSCKRNSPFALGSNGYPRAGVATMFFPPKSKAGKNVNETTLGLEKSAYDFALETHFKHALVQGTTLDILCDPIIEDVMFNKQTMIVKLLLSELSKPEDERLDWLVWVDADTMILDYCRPWGIFMPPKDSDINHLIAFDGNAHNAGVFALRVCQWSLEYMVAVLAWPYYRPEVKLEWAENSVMDMLLKEERFVGQVRAVPQAWFNTYPRGSAEEYEKAIKPIESKRQDCGTRLGDFLIHFAGQQERTRVMRAWATVLKDMPSVWEHEEYLMRNVTLEEVRKFYDEGNGKVIDGVEEVMKKAGERKKQEEDARKAAKWKAEEEAKAQKAKEEERKKDNANRDGN